MQVQRNKAIVGQNAFAHEAGIHQDGMLKDRSTYEIMKPEDVGMPRTELVLGKHSGRHALRQRINDLGYHLDDEPVPEASSRRSRSWPTARRTSTTPTSKRWPKRRSTAAPAVVDSGGLHLQRRHRRPSRRPPSACGTRTARSIARRRLGDGPVDAVFKSIERITGIDVTLRDYRVRSVTIGEDAQGESSSGSRVRAAGRCAAGR